VTLPAGRVSAYQIPSPRSPINSHSRDRDPVRGLTGVDPAEYLSGAEVYLKDRVRIDDRNERNFSVGREGDSEGLALELDTL
jgi:hypothetical protein